MYYFLCNRKLTACLPVRRQLLLLRHPSPHCLLKKKEEKTCISKPMWRKIDVEGESPSQIPTVLHVSPYDNGAPVRDTACPSCSIVHIAEARCRLPAFPVARGFHPASQRAGGYCKNGGEGGGAREVMRRIPRSLSSSTYSVDRGEMGPPGGFQDGEADTMHQDRSHMPGLVEHRLHSCSKHLILPD